MTFNLNYFLAALGLLWIPLPFSLSEGKLGLYHERVESATLKGMARAWQNWADLLRAAAGTWQLMFFSITPDSAQPASPSTIFYLQMAILLVGLIIQTVRLGSEVNLFAPLFYLTGITVILGGYAEGGFAAICAWTMAIGTRNFRFLLPTMAMTLLGAGMAFQILRLQLCANVALIFLPLGLSLVLQKRIWFLAREKKRSGRRVLARASANSVASAAASAKDAGRKLKPAAAPVKRDE